MVHPDHVSKQEHSEIWGKITTLQQQENRHEKSKNRNYKFCRSNSSRVAAISNRATLKDEATFTLTKQKTYFKYFFSMMCKWSLREYMPHLN